MRSRHAPSEISEDDTASTAATASSRPSRKDACEHAAAARADGRGGSRVLCATVKYITPNKPIVASTSARVPRMTKNPAVVRAPP